VGSSAAPPTSGDAAPSIEMKAANTTTGVLRT
jgi:hypothetical protein